MQWLPIEKTSLMDNIKSEVNETTPNAGNVPVLNPVLLDQIRSLDPSGGAELINKILHAFLNSADDQMQKLEDAFLNEDADSLGRIAHSLKSSSANIGAESLSEMFKQLEAHGRAGRISSCKSTASKHVSTLSTCTNRNQRDTESNMITNSFRVLLADDDVTARFLMQAALEKAGFKVTLACDGEEAIRLFESIPVDMVMLDVEMPHLDGYQVMLDPTKESRKRIANYHGDRNG